MTTTRIRATMAITPGRSAKAFNEFLGFMAIKLN
jgi:hypothetical protein